MIEKTATSDPTQPSQSMLAILSICLATLMAMIDTGITNTALPTIAREFSTGEATVVWAVTSYLLAMVACTLPMASLGEVYGFRRIFIGGLVIFTLASLLCGLSWSLPTLVASRILQGVGAAGLLSTNLALIRFIFPPQKLGFGLGLNALCMGLGFSLGPTLASCILWFASWHWLFLINVPIGLVSLVMALQSLPQTPFSAYRFDRLAAFFCAIGFAALVLAIGEGAHRQPLAVVIVVLSIALVCISALVYRQRHHPAPFLAFDLFGYRIFALSILAVFFAFIAQGIAFVALPFSFQSILHRSQFETGFLIAPWPAMAAMTSTFTGRLSDRFSPAALVAIGMLFCALGMYALSLLTVNTSTWMIVFCMMLCGCGMGFFNAPNQRIIMFSTPASRSGAAGGIMGIARLLGQSIGSALVAFCLIISSQIGPRYALWCGAACFVIALILGGFRMIGFKGNG